MPSIGHLLLGGMLSLILYYFGDKKKFTKYHAFILFVNNYLGPDLGWVLLIGEYTHTIVGFAIFALFIAFFFSYFTRFSPDFKHKDLTEHPKQVRYLNTLCLVIAGGTMHNYLDGIINHEGHFYIVPEIGAVPEVSPTIQDFIDIWAHGALGDSVIAIVVGMTFVMGFIYYFTHVLQHTSVKSLVGTAIYISAFLVCFYLLGNMTTYHGDAGAIFYSLLFWIFPLGLCLLSIKIPEKTRVKAPITAVTPEDGPNEQETPPSSVKKETLGGFLAKISLAFFYVIGILLVVGGIGALAFTNVITGWVISHYSSWFPYAAELGNFLLVGGIFLIAAGAITMFVGYKLKRGGQADFRFSLLHAWQFIAAFFPILIGIVALTLTATLTQIIFTFLGDTIGGYVTTPQVMLLLQVVALVLIILGGINYLLGFGLLQRSERWRRIIFMYNICWAWSIVGLVFACYLSETGVRAKFQYARNPESIKI